MKSERVAVGDHEITKRQRYREIVAVLARHGFGDALRAELDYGREATNEEFFRAIFKSDRGFNIPDVIEQYTRSRVLTEVVREHDDRVDHPLLQRVDDAILDRPCPSGPRSDHQLVTAGTTHLVEQSVSTPAKASHWGRHKPGAFTSAAKIYTR